MENKAHALAAGIFVALLSLLVLGLAAWLTRQTGVRDPYEISTKETVTGLQEQAPVRFRGVDVGKVTRIGFDPKVTGNVLVRMDIDRDTPLTTNSFATLSYQGVTGLAFIQLADEGKPAPRLVPNDEVPPRIPLRPGILSRLEEHGEVILQRVEEVTGRVDKLLGDENQKRVADALENISAAATSTRQLVGHVDTTLQKKLDPALDQFGVTLRGAQRTVDDIGATAREFHQTAQRLNAPGGPLDRVSQGTDALATTMETFSTSTLPRLNRVADETTRTVRTLDRAIDQLTENPQMLIYGRGPAQPGPGEPGFQAQGERQ
ncbi:MCE family protein [Ramlibacter ginsenosidimutans]|uniref:MCE family protein n=1 Tax=Ramlibacter ginsenosidimutans TaxID=502333 RepID=A0A934TS52_9BURK|nr:MlaD family protein [Ramlibacter ginsenosidimutans]MBK6005971.1 MCE family protein [Ramlibacter ginsenosidimutans]